MNASAFYSKKDDVKRAIHSTNAEHSTATTGRASWSREPRGGVLVRGEERLFVGGIKADSIIEMS